MLSPSQLAEKLRHLLTNPLSMREILNKLDVPPDSRRTLRAEVKRLADKGVIIRIRGARYGLPDKMNLITGTVQGHPDRFGFLIPDDRDETDVFLGPRTFDRAMHGDKVVVRIEKSRSDGRREGSVIRILERGQEKLVGIFERYGAGGFVVPAERRIVQDIIIPPDKTLGARPGEAVVITIDLFPGKREKTVGSVIEVLGNPDDPAVELEIVVAKYDLRSRFPREVTQEAKKLEAPSEREYGDRLDLRNRREIVTIDGESAKDFDDAVEVERLRDGWRLGVHIADVSHYVTPGSPLDKEAFKRGNSVYFPGSVIPMLPFELSNDICSLNPKVDRLTMSCVMEFDDHGALRKHTIANSVIRSAERMTYTDVAAIIEKKDAETTRQYQPLVPAFERMAELAELLRQRRFENGAIDFDLPEPEIILDVTGKPENIIKTERNVAHRLIEEFMLVANKTVAGRLLEKNRAAPFRIHDEPDQLKVQTFRDFVSAFGVRIPPNEPLSGKTMQKVLAQFTGSPEEKLVTTVLLRTMMQARYTTENRGHFGLGFAWYTHFTSPIRRYPDLLVHRLLKEIIVDKPQSPEDEEEMERACAHCSVTERNAEEAEREVVKLRQTQYMTHQVGEEFDGVISGVTSFGMFVELLDPPVEGLIRLTALYDDYYHYNQTEHALYGERTKKRFRLGDAVRIVVTEVSVEKRQIDFELVELRSQRGARVKFKGKALGLAKRNVGKKGKKTRRGKTGGSGGSDQSRLRGKKRRKS